MKSVRLHLLVLALLPLVVLIPTLLTFGMARWTASFNALLITNVASDLRIAEQYLQRIMAQSSSDIQAIAGSVSFAQARKKPAALERYLDEQRQRLGWDFLYHLTNIQQGRRRTMASHRHRCGWWQPNLNRYFPCRGPERPLGNACAPSLIAVDRHRSCGPNPAQFRRSRHGRSQRHCN